MMFRQPPGLNEEGKSSELFESIVRGDFMCRLMMFCSSYLIFGLSVERLCSVMQAISTVF